MGKDGGWWGHGCNAARCKETASCAHSRFLTASEQKANVERNMIGGLKKTGGRALKKERKRKKEERGQKSDFSFTGTESCAGLLLSATLRISVRTRSVSSRSWQSIPHIFDPLAFPVFCHHISSTAPRSAAPPAGNL